jgi:hypothetical protein
VAARAPEPSVSPIRRSTSKFCEARWIISWDSRAEASAVPRICSVPRCRASFACWSAPAGVPGLWF